MPDEMKGYAYRLESTTAVAAPITQAFAFLDDPASLPALDPAWVDARLMTGKGECRSVGVEAEYVLRWFGVPLYLRLVVTRHEAPHRLALAQVEGPWRTYTQTFELRREGRTTVIDERAEFRGGRGPFEHCVHRFLVRRQLHAVARFRRHALIQALGRPQDDR